MNRAREFSVDEILKDGTRVTIRAVRPDDRQRFLQAFKLLERDSIYTRFFSARGEPSDADLDRAVNVDFEREVALVVTTIARAGEVIIATARYVTIGERSAEVAFVVEEDYQGRGIASRLVGHLARIAKDNGIAQLEADVLSQNASMLAVFRKCGLSARRSREGGVVHLTLTLS
jgi:GNAT superfamily N-acetyltransferase